MKKKGPTRPARPTTFIRTKSHWRTTLKIQFQFGRVLFALAGRRLTGNVGRRKNVSPVCTSTGAVSASEEANQRCFDRSLRVCCSHGGHFCCRRLFSKERRTTPFVARRGIYCRPRIWHPKAIPGLCGNPRRLLGYREVDSLAGSITRPPRIICGRCLLVVVHWRTCGCGELSPIQRRADQVIHRPTPLISPESSMMLPLCMAQLFKRDG